MPRPEIDIIADLSIASMNLRVRSQIAMMKGLHEIKVHAKRELRSTRANAYYWAAVVKPFFDFLREQEPLLINEPEQAHIELKRQVLGTQAVLAGKATVRAVRTTHDMTTPQFLDYVERARFFLREMVGIETLDPGEYGVKPPEKQEKETSNA